MQNMDWVNEVKIGDYFTVVEGDNRFQLLTHAAPLPLKWTGVKYEPAQEGDLNISIKGVCWVLQDGRIKKARLPYSAVKQIKALMDDPEYAFDEFPMPRALNLRAIGSGTKEVQYSLIPSPKESPVSAEILAELAKKPTPEEMVESEKGQSSDSSEDSPFS